MVPGGMLLRQTCSCTPYLAIKLSQRDPNKEFP
jgi:hypothetical protein